MSKNVVGFVLIDAPHSALNNAGSDAGERVNNAVKVKIMRKGFDTFPYVSGQAWRYWWRDTLEKKFGWKMSPIERAEKIAFTEADPFEYPDDDVFGYMRAPKLKRGTKNPENAKTNEGQSSKTLTRSSPLKNSPLVSILSQKPTDDFGVMARQKEGDPVPYEHQFYSTVLKGIFSLDLNNLGRFSSINKSGYRNMSEIDGERVKKYNASVDGGFVTLPREIRLKRARDIIESIQFLSGGAKQSTHLTDVTPKLILLACIDGGNHPFMNIVREVDRSVFFDFEALRQVIEDYSESFLTDLYIGHATGFMDQLSDGFQKFAKEPMKGISTVYQSVGNCVKSFSASLENIIE